ncbi:MAG: gliding motility-associated C-terminal domain-containing protein [Bacteroidales bacterium]|jgi:gliding motility-associated-like protein|nr:gliding motility-associated C-terminal domain-containing protein [Bacteroidales bacterium]
MTTEQLKGMLQGMSETPSPHCWEAVQQQIGVVAGGAATAAASKGVSVAAKGAFSSGKIAAISAAAATVVAGAVATIVSIVSNPKTDAPTLANNAPIEQIAPLSTDSATATLDPQTSQFNSESITEPPSPIMEIPQNPVIISPENTPPTSPTAQPPANTTSATLHAPTYTPTSTPPATANASQNNPQTTIPKPQHISSSSEDPVTENMSQQDLDQLKEIINISIPNTITPNGDGYNDTWIITGLDKCEEYQLIILNRNRKEVFRTKRYENNWNASSAEGEQFYYILIYKANGIQERRSGILNVIR